MPMCVECGKDATKGSLKHPYCRKYFKKEYGTGKVAQAKYDKFLREVHL